MRLAALTILIIGNLLANQVHAEDVSTQPLTRVDCDKAEMAWDENANVCIADSGNVSRQPLTRLDCENAGMAWDDTANVCGEASQAAEERPEPPVAEPMSKPELADTLIQPLTRHDCDKAEMAWDENANVCIANSGNVSRQPLTRLDCENAGMAWNDTANVCGEASQAAEERPEPQIAQPMSKSELADTLIQPLTRHECDKAGMTWNDTTNVCDEKSQDSATQTGPKETNPVASTVLINIDKASQKMTVFLDGLQQYEWPVSTGIRGYTTPSGTYTTSSMNKIWYSRQWDDAPMPHAVFFTKEGHAIHGTNEVKRLGKPASHGCVRISPEDAATLYDLVATNGLENAQVVLSGLTPGGEGKVASPGRSKSQYRRAARTDHSYTKPRKRSGFFRRLFGRR